MLATNYTKQCSKCKITKLLSEFYKCSPNKDGLRYDCKACCRAYARSEVGKASHAKHRKTEKCKLYRAEYRKTEVGKLSMTKGLAKYNAANPIKRKAQNTTNYATRSGRMERPDSCEECFGTGKIEAHHNDYALPLDVRWLCRSCHKAWHTENGQGLNGN